MDMEKQLVKSIKSYDVNNVFNTIYKGACLNQSIQYEGKETTALLESITLSNQKVGYSITQILLLHGADPDFESQGRIPIIEAVKLDHFEIVRILLESGADKSNKDSKGKTALLYAKEQKFEDINALLLGEETETTIKFKRYVFEEVESSQNEELDRENYETFSSGRVTPLAKPAEFLLEVEKIFEKEIVGTPLSSTTNRHISSLERDMDEVTELLEQVGFRTPLFYSTKLKTLDKSSAQKERLLDRYITSGVNDGYKEKVEKYLESIADNAGDAVALSLTCDTATQKRPEMLYSRQKATMYKVNELKEHIPKDQRSNIGDKKFEAKDLGDWSRNSTLVSQDSDKTGLLLAVSLANSNCLTYSEEYIIQDQYCGIELIEKRIPSLQNIASQDEDLLRRFEEEAEIVSDGSKDITLGSVSNYSCDRIRKELYQYGETPQGPLNSATRRAYLVRLKKLKLGLIVPRNQLESKYPSPMAESLRNISNITRNWERLWKLEEQMTEHFNHVDPKIAATINFLTRETVCKSSFNYLLLDPRKSQNLPFKVFSWGDQDLWRTFVDSVFYIGKGTRSRPFQHLYDAASRKKITKKHIEKVETILDIWKEGFGVVSLQLFNNSIAVEGFTREAAMIDALGLHNLTNAKPGDYYGPCKLWKKEKRLQLGTFLLYRAFKIFLQEGERQIRPVDLKISVNYDTS